VLFRSLLFAVSTLVTADEYIARWDQIVHSYQAGQITLDDARSRLLKLVAQYHPGNQNAVDLVNQQYNTEWNRLYVIRMRQRTESQAQLRETGRKLAEADMRDAVQRAVDDAMWRHRNSHGCR
jgi:hypothetical protein